jgi:glutaredoxin 3
MSARVEVYFTTYCHYCRRAMRLLDNKGVAYERFDVTGNQPKRTWLREVTGRRTVPQIFINGRSVGGSDEIHALDAAGRLDGMLAEDPAS